MAEEKIRRSQIHRCHKKSYHSHLCSYLYLCFLSVSFGSVSSTCKQYALSFFSIVAVAASSCSGKSSNILIAFKYPIYFSSQFLFFLSIWLLEIFLFRRITSFIS